MFYWYLSDVQGESGYRDTVEELRILEEQRKAEEKAKAELAAIEAEK